MFRPSFIDLFCIFSAKITIKIYFSAIITLTPIAVEKVGPHNAAHDKTHDATHDKILAFCMTPHSKAEIAEYCGHKNTKNFTNRYLRPLLDAGSLKMTLPDNPKRKNQKYITVHSE